MATPGSAHNPAVKTRHFAQLVALSALWGASFLFLRIASPLLGPLVLAGVRVALVGRRREPLVELARVEANGNYCGRLVVAAVRQMFTVEHELFSRRRNAV